MIRFVEYFLFSESKNEYVRVFGLFTDFDNGLHIGNL